MSETRPALACGSWPSPVTAAMLSAASRPVAQPLPDGPDLWWLQGRPEEGGRLALMRRAAGAAQAECMTPAPLNVRSRVHEYGGGAYAVRHGTAVFSNFADGRVWRVEAGGGEPVPITAASACRHADFAFDPLRPRVYAVQEDHAGPGEPVASLVALPLDGAAKSSLLGGPGGPDFVAAPRPSPDGTRLAWLAWHHPAMPWDGTELWCAEVAPDGLLHAPRRIAGGPGEALVAPRWHPDGTLFVVSDRSGFWNLYRVETLDGPSGLAAVAPMAADCGEPMWVFGQSLWDFDGTGHAVLAPVVQARSHLVRVPLSGGEPLAIPLPFDEMQYLCVADGQASMVAASATEPAQVLRLELATHRWESLARSTDLRLDPAGLSRPQAVRYPNGGGTREAHAWFYPPASALARPLAGERPPLLVVGHGGPTGMSSAALKPSLQYWTSRGFAVLDVNYGGSTGFGREYRRRLEGQWGVVDVEDCVAGARWLAGQGLVDGRRMAIRGGSAGGFTVLRALMFHDAFAAGASHYGVTDLAALDADTHKFESRYLQSLICAPGDRARVYAERSPSHHADRLRAPMIFLQGLDDKVVPPSQSRGMVQSLRARGVPVAYVEFEGEGHGFRQPQNQRRALECELAFYGRVFGFEPADELPPLAIDGLPGPTGARGGGTGA